MRVIDTFRKDLYVSKYLFGIYCAETKQTKFPSLVTFYPALAGETRLHLNHRSLRVFL